MRYPKKKPYVNCQKLAENGLEQKLLGDEMQSEGILKSERLKQDFCESRRGKINFTESRILKTYLTEGKLILIRRDHEKHAVVDTK